MFGIDACPSPNLSADFLAVLVIKFLVVLQYLLQNKLTELDRPR